ncbi:hypothetical protein CFRA_06600 [Corynebacterium frankenforstense DSM 45800]|uniref:Lipoprotein n=1 Tax=Corynebacterium frankenforstense DSM 45800 TaxID=1437875 RepID=A0A1L7CSZ2_9CORY|nr:hypothetical protein [Corynebacterium frankenforstense]APT88976.1 hypothetical protein CFRA_06600 [Corynebacterium frankenforstense DSM 45800]
MSTNKRRLLFRATSATAAAAIAATVLTSCSDSGEGDGSDTAAATSAASVEEAAEQNRDREVDERFGDRPQVLADASGTGVESSALFFDSSESVVLAGPDVADQLRAASAAVAAHAPLLEVTPETAGEVADEIERLGASIAVTFGDVKAPDVEGLTVVRAPAGEDGLEQLTSLSFERTEVPADKGAVRALAEFDAENPQELAPGAGLENPAPAEAAPAEGEAPAADGAEGSPDAQPAEDKDENKDKSGGEAEQSGESGDAEGALPVSTPRENPPVVLATPESPAVDVANARAYGADVYVMDYPDPRVSEEASKAVAGLADRPLVALGAQFGSAERLTGAIEASARETAELPGGGHLVFPGRRMVALYGHPSGGDLGVMGERPPQESVDYVRGIVDQYQAIDEDEPVIPTFEIIATVASEFPGEDGDYSNEATIEELTPWVDAITDAGGYAVLDLQPGRGNFLDQAKRYEELLKRPNVGLALDPEWHMGPDELPAQRVGSVEAHEVDEVSEWLAQLVRDNNLPQKAFVVHQFQVQMLRDREQINTDHAELSYVLHADGHGVPEQKFDTWNVLRQGLDPVWNMAWKNFFDEDQPMFDAQQTFAVEPRPWFISYQ